MSELRLVPGALVVWAVTLFLLFYGAEMVTVLVVLLGLVIVAVVLVWCRQSGQALFTTAVGATAVALTVVRIQQAARWIPAKPLLGEVSAAPVEVSSGGYLVRLAVDGYPAVLPVFSELAPEHLAIGSQVLAQVNMSSSQRPGVGDQVATGELQLVEGPTGMAAFAAQVRESFSQSVVASVGTSSQGLIPGMVLGDTSGQSVAERELYIVTGLSHLSAVSGANVAIVTTAAVLVCRLLTLGPRIQIGVATGALVGFVGLVGTEPSVLRASVTGLVGLLAVLNSSRMEPIHGLSLAVIGLIFWDSDLAASYGFALSVAATAGIIALYPLLYRPLAATGLPAILMRAVAVAVAADIVTMPIIALMAGEVSLVSVVANVLVAVVVPPVTVLGLLAAGLSMLPGGLEVILLWVIEPCTWWIHQVASVGAGLGLATVSASPAWVLVAYGWIIAAVVGGHAGKTLVVLAIWFVVAARGEQTAPELDIGELSTHVVKTVEDLESVPPGTHVIIVLDSSGQAAQRPTVTRQGIPVLFPHRDGEVTVHSDGTQHAGDGRF
ncbi:ComEC/Rec2 family competence protein [Corynebacterium alimapuense]|uniref:Competence protein ComEC n=1 Tax=Corynebacterium alimapuense TaxID=1576874 RepID=A0A3M8KAP7_9CORY|nr:ComEC/Rec2 family competence protein [Corynebacterium alimapuense]RNE49624.1 competence protein ComEC [Corynebacterium alimapuense]